MLANSSFSHRGPGVFETVQTVFDGLTTGPQPLAVDGGALGHGLPDRLINLAELRSLLLHPSVGYPARDAAWTGLVERAQGRDPAWTVGLVGMLLPGLRRAAGRLVRHYAADVLDPADVDAEVLRALLDAVAGFDPAGERIARRLVAAAYRGGRLACRRAYAETRRHGTADESAAPLWPYGHPDLVLIRAAEAGVISAAEANLIGWTRLEGQRVNEIAAILGESADTIRHRRVRAEARLRDWILAGQPVAGKPAVADLTQR
jgi:DNA-directed RNA polymerase specialized sigma24 family protein